jgi:hypothetical protein
VKLPQSDFERGCTAILGDRPGILARRTLRQARRLRIRSGWQQQKTGGQKREPVAAVEQSHRRYYLPDVGQHAPADPLGALRGLIQAGRTESRAPTCGCSRQK